jgi:hypothetical protein
MEVLIIHSYNGSGREWCYLQNDTWSTHSFPQICLANTPDSPVYETDEFSVWDENNLPMSVPWRSVCLPNFTECLDSVFGDKIKPALIILHVSHARISTDVAARTFWQPGYDFGNELNLSELRAQWKANKNKYGMQMVIQDQIVRQVRHKINHCSCKYCYFNRGQGTNLRYMCVFFTCDYLFVRVQRQ